MLLAPPSFRKLILYFLIISPILVFLPFLNIFQLFLPKIIVTSFSLIIFLIYWIKEKTLPFHHFTLFWLLILVTFLALSGIGWEQFSSVTIPFLLVWFYFLPISSDDILPLAKISFFSITIINFFQIILLGLEKKKLIYPTGNPTYNALILITSFLIIEKLDFSFKNSQNKKYLLYFSLLLFQLLLLQSRTGLLFLIIYFLITKFKISIKKVIKAILILNIVLAITLFLFPNILHKLIPINYRFYIWSLFPLKDNFFITDTALFKQDSFFLQQKLVQQNFNFIYQVLPIETLHNDFLEIIYDFSYLGLFFFFWIIKEINSLSEEKLLYLFPFFFFASFHTIIYSFSALTFLLLILKVESNFQSYPFSSVPKILYLTFLIPIFILLIVFHIIASLIFLEKGMEKLSQKYFQKSEIFTPTYYLPYFLEVQLSSDFPSFKIKQALSQKEDSNIYQKVASLYGKKFNQTGKIHFLLKKKIFLEKALKLDPLNPFIRSELISILNLLGRKKELQEEIFLLKNLKLPHRFSQWKNDRK